jgi:hypothetical protein
MANKQYTVPQSSTPGSGGGGGSGTVTSVGLTVNSTSPSGIFTVTGSPVSTSGTLNVNLAGTSGGVPYFSSSTVLSSSLALASTGVVLGGGAATAPSTSTQLTFSAPTLTVGLAGTSSGILSLTGSTSGNATITAPATAGTSTNPVAFSNNIAVPNGTTSAPSYAFNTFSGVGMSYDTTTGTPVIAGGNGSNFCALFTLTGLAANVRCAINGVNFVTRGDLGGYCWTSGGTSTGTIDTGLSRDSAGTIDVGAGSQGDKTGSMNMTNLTASGTVRANTGFSANGTAGVSAGSFSAITAITTVSGIVTQLTGSSDERLKDTVPYTGGLAEIETITPVKYTWNSKGQEHTGLSGTRQYVGFTAQNVQKSIPEAITSTELSKDGTETYLSFDDRPVLAALLNAVKELSSRVKELENR